MVPEALVFKTDDGAGKFVWNGIGGREAPLSVGSDTGAEQAAVAALEHGADRVVEQPAGPQRPGDEYQQGNQAGQEQKILFISHPIFLYLQ